MKLFIKLLTLWSVMLFLFSLYCEYIISRETNYFLQIILTLTIFILTIISIELIIKLITKKQ
jgi:hypothetical protein